ncbi:MAG TPA: lipase family protein [Bryobacteraceae bacterium]|nr:lipase family protein [Bryobacteraceae bacterium]
MREQSIQPKRSTRLLPGTLKNLFFPPEPDEYEYFRVAGQNPFLADGDIVKAAWAADAAMLSYARYGSRRMSDGELEENLARGGLKLKAKIGENPLDWNAPGTQAFFATGKDFALLAFRGTEADDPADSKADLDILLVHEPEYKGFSAPPLGHLSLIEHLSIPCLVHHGFQAALNRVWESVHDLLTQYRAAEPQAEICITGHSLGGALALLTYSRFADPNTSAYTIGCPRVGNGAFRKRVAANPGRGHYRIVNLHDLVAHVPLESALYMHSPIGCYQIDEAGCLNYSEVDETIVDLSILAKTFGGLPADFKTNPQAFLACPAPPGLVDHSPARYCMRLWDFV